MMEKKILIEEISKIRSIMGLYLNESPPYHSDMDLPKIAKKAQHGYLEGDSPELLGKNVWFHTNRHNIKKNRNGGFGVFGLTSRGKKDAKPGIIGYTNDILLGGDITFDISPGYHEIMRTTKDKGQMSKRQQKVGVGGTVMELPDDPMSFKENATEIKYNPFLSDFFFTPGGENKIVGADNVYAEYRPDGTYSLHAINPVTEPFEPGEFNP
jgi:hypothetical protein